MAPQQYMQCPHGFHIDECDICTDRRMHYLRRIGGNNRGSNTWQTIHQNTLQELANTIYPEGFMIHEQNIGRFLNGFVRSTVDFPHFIFSIEIFFATSFIISSTISILSL